MNHTPFSIAINGKIASGKDTVGALLINRLAPYSIKHTAFAYELKKQVTEAMGVIRLAHEQGVSKEDTVPLLDRLFTDVDTEDNERLLDHLYETVVVEGTQDAWQRTDGVRAALQLWGTDVRRKNSVDYWVDFTVAHVLDLAQDGHSTIITDARFPNELNALRTRVKSSLNVRLDVSRQTQVDRLWERDKLPLTPEREFHSSETAVDDYPFDLRIQTDNLSPEGIVDQIVHLMIERELI